jgi:translation initiation factor 2B subunit (eIF-2B alpha/beta/delta family)
MSRQAIEAFEDKLHELLEDNRSGSRLIALRAAALMEEAAADPVFRRTELIKLLKDTCRSLERIHGSMRIVSALCDDVVLILDTAPPEEELRRKLAELFNRWNDLYRNRVMTRLLANALPLLRGCSSFISHSHSSTVLAVLGELAKESPGLKAIQTISAPNNEGLVMARLLAEAGIEVELIADAGLAGAIERADAALLGADVVGLDGVVNKIGTLGLTLAARQYGKPAFVAFDTGKLLQPGREVDIKERNPSELATPDHERIRVRNVYFERTPLELFTRFVTEEGDYDHEQIRMVIENLKER